MHISNQKESNRFYLKTQRHKIESDNSKEFAAKPVTIKETRKALGERRPPPSILPHLEQC